MMKLIDKDKIVSEIKELIRANELYLSESNTDELRFQKVCAYSVLNDLLHFIDTLEVKEVDLNKEIKDYFNNQPIITRSKSIDYQLIPSGEEIAKYFFELGLKAQKGE